jgi:DNA-binding response OmpR family regulator
MDATAPELDEFDIVRRGSRWAALAPLEARIIEVFLGRLGRVVRRSEFAVVWPHGMPAPRAVDGRLVLLRERTERPGLRYGAPNARSVDSRIKALRKRVAPLAIRIHTFRGHGYLADFNPPT